MSTYLIYNCSFLASLLKNNADLALMDWYGKNQAKPLAEN